MKKLVMLLGASALLCSTAYAEVYSKEKLMVIDKNEAGGGVGVLSGQYAFTRDKAQDSHAIREIVWLSLKPGDTVGYHKHENNEDAYIIVSGEGAFKDADGTETVVKAGDITIVRAGQSHALANTGKEPLVFLSVIAQK